MKLKIELVNPKRLNASAYNPRRMSPAEMEKLRRSLREFGFVEPVVVQIPGNRIIGGHQRIEAALAEGMAKVPVLRLRISDRRAKTLNLALNRIQGEWDSDKLQALLQELQLEGEDLNLTGFEADEITKLLAESLNGKEIQELQLRPAPAIVWYLIGIPLDRFGEVQSHVAALEQAAEISVQSSRDKP